MSNPHDKAMEHMMIAAAYLASYDYIACNGHLEAAMKQLVLVSLEKVADDADKLAGDTRTMRESINYVANVTPGSVGINHGCMVINNGSR